MSRIPHQLSDPEIQILRVSGIVDCGFCSVNLNDLTLLEREEHYELHFSAAPGSLKSSHGAQVPHTSTPAEKNIQSSKKFKKLNDKGKQKEIEPIQSDKGVFWHYGLPVPPPQNYTQGLIPLLKQALLSSHAQGSTLRAVLCSDRVIHVSRTSLDAGWGCGYRNFQMACAALMDQNIQPDYSTLLSGPPSPGVRDLQRWIEDAWNAGFDPQGAQQLKKLVGTKKWLGTADLYVAFVYRGIPTELVDINLTDRPPGAEIVKDWIVNYFSPKPDSTESVSINDALRGASPIVVTDRMPIILQYQGHSRTIVGYEVTKTGKIKSLMFDPSMKFDNEIKHMALAICARHTTSSGPQKRLSGSSPPLRPTKRSRSSLENVISIDDDNEVEVLVSESSPERKHKNTREDKIKGNPEVSVKILHKFLDRLRLHPRGLRRMEYQILYFPMEQPLSERDKLNRRIITSTKY